jgi:thymidylate synthase (FAD)
MHAELIDVMGSDLTVVNAARVSMGKRKETLDEADERLIRYLARHGHWTPFAQPQLQFRFKAPIFVARQWFKHQIGTTRNEISRRYVSDAPEFFTPDAWRGKAENVKQGSTEGPIDPELGKHAHLVYQDALDACQRAYEQLLYVGVCPEQARMVLPQSMYTEWIETMSLATCARIAKLRLDPHAQKETRMLAEKMAGAAEQKFPVSWRELRNG